MRINHNIASMVTTGALFQTERAVSVSIERLSTGLRINRASDDAAGLGISENLRTQVRGLGQALKNTQDAISMLNIADGALNEQAEVMQRMRELVIQAKNDTYTQTERAYMYQEFRALMEEVDRIARVTNFNGMMLFAAPEATGLDIRRGYDDDYEDGFNVNGLTTNHASNDQRDIWDDPANAIFGANDDSSSHHFNMMIGANWQEEDINAYQRLVSGHVPNQRANAVGDRGAANMMTIQLGQMDVHALLTINPFGGGGGGSALNDMGDARELWDSFDWDVGTGFPDSDTEDFYLDVLSEDVPSLGEQGLGAKLNYLLQVIDGKGGEWPGNLIPWAYNGDTNITGLERINRMRGAIGSWMNRLEYSASNTMNQITYQQAAESVIRDVDFAQETARFTRNAILVQSGTAMLTQANLSPQSVLQLIQ